MSVFSPNDSHTKPNFYKKQLITMKITAVVVLVVACVAVSAADPAINAIDWTAVGNKVEEMEALVRDTVGKIRDTANADNAAVGAELGKLLDAAAVKANAIYIKVKDAIQAQTLDEAQAKAHLLELQDILVTLQEDAQASLAQLSAAAADAIRDIFVAHTAKAQQQAQELYVLLRA